MPFQDDTQFTLLSQPHAPDQDGEDVTLAELRGRPVVLLVYPKAGTPG